MMDDWLWTPYLEPAQTGLAVLLLVALALCGTLALWPVRVPGEVTPDERRGLHLGTLAPILAHLVRAAPWFIVAGTLLLFFPVALPRTLFLSSRARWLDPEQPRAWPEAWSALVATTPSTGPGLDLGPLVDSVCERLVQSRPGRFSDWRVDAPDTRRFLIETVRAELEKPAPEPSPADRVPHRVETRLPRWVVESIELAILKAQTQRCNASRVVALLADRPTDSGQAWDPLDSYVSVGSPRFLPTRLNVVRRPTPSQARLEQIFDLRYQANTGWLASCLFAVPARLPGQPEQVVVPLRIQMPEGRSGSACAVTFPLDEAPRLWRRELVFPADAAAPRPVGIQQPSEPPLFRSAPADQRSGPVPVLLRVPAPEDWRRATEALLVNDPALIDWRNRLAERRLSLSNLAWSDSEGRVVLDTLTHPGSVWIYPTGGQLPPTDRLPVPPGETCPCRTNRRCPRSVLVGQRPPRA